MTPMQEFALQVLKECGNAGTCGSYIGARWQEHKGRRRNCASRDQFGATAAGYRALRALVSAGLARVETTGYSIETYYYVEQLEVGKIYALKCQRKGSFQIRLTHHDDEWITGVIIKGKTRAILKENESEEGEEVTTRKSFCTFTEVVDTSKKSA